MWFKMRGDWLGLCLLKLTNSSRSLPLSETGRIAHYTSHAASQTKRHNCYQLLAYYAAQVLPWFYSIAKLLEPSSIFSYLGHVGRLGLSYVSCLRFDRESQTAPGKAREGAWPRLSFTHLSHEIIETTYRRRAVKARPGSDMSWPKLLPRCPQNKPSIQVASLEQLELQVAPKLADLGGNSEMAANVCKHDQPRAITWIVSPTTNHAFQKKSGSSLASRPQCRSQPEVQLAFMCLCKKGIWATENDKEHQTHLNNICTKSNSTKAHQKPSCTRLPLHESQW